MLIKVSKFLVLGIILCSVIFVLEFKRYKILGFRKRLKGNGRDI